MSLWRGSTLTDRGRVRAQLEDSDQDDDSSDSAADEEEQADLQRWTG